ncbi:MAG: UDP-2,3-diacylglucosamine diphosphatase [Gammaproteobacteria bacterium]|nr:MAG: UDP-2,3-diacylglucosamine diphosphatase [Gammaproteobacteria bacterium]
MPKTVFIADLHLDKHYPDAVSAFLRYMDHLATQSVDALYILGDLFDYWLGDDCVDKTAARIAEALSRFHSNTQTPIYFIHGNRDFLLGENYARRCQMKILAECEEINLYGVKTLVLHGDTLCTDDIAYQQFREKVRNPQWQAKILKLPAWLRRLKALYMRRQSKKANSNKNALIMDVSQTTVETVMRQHGATQMIHGHTHRPAIHEFDLNGRTVKRCVVGDWYTQGSALEVTKNGCELVSVSL